jgi:hypothetical protein
MLGAPNFVVCLLRWVWIALIEQTHEVFQTQAKDTFAARCRNHFAGAFPQATALRKAEKEGQNREGKEDLKLCGTSHMSGFQVKSVFLEMPEKTLNPPTLAVDLECFFSAKAVADNHDRSVSATCFRRF